MTKMASRPVYGKYHQNHLLCNQEADDLETWVLRYNKIYSNNDTRLTLTIVMTWSKLFPNVAAWVKAYTADSHAFPSFF